MTAVTATRAKISIGVVEASVLTWLWHVYQRLWRLTSSSPLTTNMKIKHDMWLDPRFADFIKKVAAEERKKGFDEGQLTLLKQIEDLKTNKRDSINIMVDAETIQRIQGWNDNSASDNGQTLGCCSLCYTEGYAGPQCKVSLQGCCHKTHNEKVQTDK